MHDGVSGHIREKARPLRQQKALTIDELAERLALSRTTIYYWVPDLPIRRTESQSLSQRQARRANKQRYSRLREEAYEEGSQTFADLSRLDQDLHELRRFWGAELDFDPASIRLQRKSNSNGLAGRTWRSRYGVLTVSCGDTYLRSRLQAWMDRTPDQWLDSICRGV